MNVNRTWVAASLLVALLLLAGCAPDATVGDVTGTVKLDDVAIAEGQITFTPVDGKAQVTGTEIIDGQYAAKRVPVGAMKVTITAPKIIGKEKRENAPDKRFKITAVETVPAKYNEKSELTFDVQPGANSKDWVLRTN